MDKIDSEFDHCIQAAPDFALRSIVAQASGVPESGC